MKSIAECLHDSTLLLSEISDSPRLDAEILLSHVLCVSRSYLFAYPEREMTPDANHEFNALIQRRLQQEPIAYIIGQQEFWSLPFTVTRDTLIPRPDTELLVETVLEKMKHPAVTLADLGTGSGAIAIALAHEKPHWDIHATDISEAALCVAQLNANRLNIKNITFHHGHWTDPLPANTLFDIIVSNPPYVDHADDHLKNPSLQYEPGQALVSDNHGLNDLQTIITYAPRHLRRNGLLIVEHGYQQAACVRDFFKKLRYHQIISLRDLSGWERITLGYRNE